MDTFYLNRFQKFVGDRITKLILLKVVAKVDKLPWSFKLSTFALFNLPVLCLNTLKLLLTGCHSFFVRKYLGMDEVIVK